VNDKQKKKVHRSNISRKLYYTYDKYFVTETKNSFYKCIHLNYIITIVFYEISILMININKTEVKTLIIEEIKFYLNFTDKISQIVDNG